MKFIVGDKVRVINCSVPIYTGMEGIITMVYHHIDAFAVSGPLGKDLYFAAKQLELIPDKPTSLPEGYGVCVCGAITPNRNIKMVTGYLCCDCKREITEQL